MKIGELIHLLIQRDPLPPLVPDNIWNEDWTAVIHESQEPALVMAGLHLWNDDIDRCHGIVQTMKGKNASYWHAILHRREPDYGNSEYWYRRVGKHPVHSELKAIYPEWDPFSFVDWCQDLAEKVSRKPLPWLKEVQAREMELLLKYIMKLNPNSSTIYENTRD